MEHSRYEYMKRSNNRVNPKQNLCIKAVCEFLGVNSEYLHTIFDLLDCISGPYTVSSKRIPHQYILVIKQGHCALMDNVGNVLVDTAPSSKEIKRVYYIN